MARSELHDARSQQAGFRFEPEHDADGELSQLLAYGYSHQRAAQRNLEPHLNEGVEICLCRSGVYRWDVEGRQVEIRPGEFSLTLPWQLHSGVNNILGPGQLSWLILAAEGSSGSGFTPGPLHTLLGSDASKILGPIEQSSVAYLGKAPGLRELFDRLDSELRNRRSGSAVVIRSLIATIVVDVSRVLAAGGLGESEAHERVPSGVVAVLEDVKRLPAHPWSTAEMARESGLGVTAFTDWCRRVSGRSPRWYVLEQRLVLGRELLRSGYSVTNAAMETGFSSSQHFSAAFRKLYGQTPTAWRAQVQ